MRKPKNISASDMKASRDRLSQMAAVAGRFQSFRPAVDVLTKVRAVPTIFPQQKAVEMSTVPFIMTEARASFPGAYSGLGSTL